MKIKNKLFFILGLLLMLIFIILVSCIKYSNIENDFINRGEVNVFLLVEDDLNFNESNNEFSIIKESKIEIENNKL